MAENWFSFIGPLCFCGGKGFLVTAPLTAPKSSTKTVQKTPQKHTVVIQYVLVHIFSNSIQLYFFHWIALHFWSYCAVAGASALYCPVAARSLITELSWHSRADGTLVSADSERAWSLPLPLTPYHRYTSSQCTPPPLSGRPGEPSSALLFPLFLLHRLQIAGG